MSQERALELWSAMSPMERYAVMQRVPYQRSVTKRLRACIALLQKEG